jgi:hypothetical protein
MTDMTAKSLAEQLNGSEYPLLISKALRYEMQRAALVIVYGASYDLMEFDGAIYDEIACYGCDTVVKVDIEGVLVDLQTLLENTEDEDELRDYFRRKLTDKEVEAIRDSDGYFWTYRTNIPHETFDVVDDCGNYCRGIVFSVDDLGSPA